jgi:hypothetical protein
MSSFEGRADVLSISQPTAAAHSRSAADLSFDAQDTPSNLRALQGLFAAPTTHDEGEQRARKRRKVDTNRALPVQSDYAQGHSIILASVILELVGGCSTHVMAEG